MTRNDFEAIREEFYPAVYNCERASLERVYSPTDPDAHEQDLAAGAVASVFQRLIRALALSDKQRDQLDEAADEAIAEARNDFRAFHPHVEV